MYTDEDLLMISGIQHFQYCKRQWGLIHLENQWEKNVHTVKGDIMHERVDDPFIMESRKGVILSRSIPLISSSLGFYGMSDAVEFVEHPEGVYIDSRKAKYMLYPVEYKVGKPKLDDCDTVQLCVQGICLEEMFDTKIEQGILYYGKTKRRETISFDESLRGKVLSISKQMHGLIDSGKTPEAVYSAKCDRCSLYNICLPKVKAGYKSVSNYIITMMSKEEA